MKLFVCGDIVPGGAISYQDKYIDEGFLKYIRSFDLRIGTLECAVGTGLNFDEYKMAHQKNVIFVRNEDFFRLEQMGFDAVSLANNHIYDLGEEGLINTIRLLDEAGIQHCGAGMNEQEAALPAVLHSNGSSIAVFGCVFKGLKPQYVTPAGPCSSGIWQTDIDLLCDKVRDARKHYDYVVVLPHWGIEHKYLPPETEWIYSRLLIDAGADAVMGSHTHVIGPVWKYKGKPVCYSMGNFLFPDFAQEVPRPMYFPETKEEFRSLPRMPFYASNFPSPVVSVWRKRNRIGRAVSLNLNKYRVRMKSAFIYLSPDNVIGRLSGKSLAVMRTRTMFWRLSFSVMGRNKAVRIIDSRYNILGRLYKRSSACR